MSYKENIHLFGLIFFNISTLQVAGILYFTAGTKDNVDLEVKK